MELEGAADADLQGRRPPWRRTVAVQAALCLALYAAFSLGEPQLRPRVGDALGIGGLRGGDLYFISVAGGARPPADQALLLRQVRASREFPVSDLSRCVLAPHRPPFWDRSGAALAGFI
jgi:hypothetical protein